MENSNNNKQLWGVVEDLSGTKKVKVPYEAIKGPMGNILTNPCDIANEFKRVFSGMGKGLVGPHQTYGDNASLPNSIVLLPTNRYEIKKIINELNSKKATDIDEISAEYLKAISLFTLDHLVHIRNMCIEKGIWPKSFENTVVIPVYKNKDENLAANYRPISLIPHMAKKFEKLLKNRLTSFINKYDLISSKQFGFKQNNPTQDTFLNLTLKVYEAYNNNKVCLCIFLNLTKAFDTVSHSNLLQTLERIGIRNNCLQLFTSYLSERQQILRIAGQASGQRDITCEIPQTIILLNLYINGLFSLRSHITGFDDDTAITYEADYKYKLKLKAETDLKLIKTWFDNKILIINFKKYFTFQYSTPI